MDQHVPEAAFDLGLVRRFELVFGLRGGLPSLFDFENDPDFDLDRSQQSACNCPGGLLGLIGLDCSFCYIGACSEQILNAR